MKRMRGVLFAALSILAFFACTQATDPNARLFPEAEIDTTLHIGVLQEGALTIFTVDKYSTVVVKIPRISSYIYSERPTRSLEQIATDSGYSLIVNGSFFDPLYDDTIAHTGLHYRHAGYLKISNTVYEDVKDDRQLSRLFAYSSAGNNVAYFPVNELEKINGYDLVIQTGPQIIWNNEVDTASINSSINGNRQARRTVFASIDGKEFYVIVTTYAVTLTDFGTMLRSTGIFRKDLSAIDFDGGPSTRIYIKNHPELDFNANTPWPLLICVK
jgi:exopolysaccharide biosynthesis protein